MLKFTIKRSEWDRGRGKDNDLVSNPISLFSPRRPDRNKCCLGFLSLACGHSLTQIENVSSLEVLETEISNPVDVPAEYNRIVRHEEAYINVNDAGDILDEQREEELKELFLKDGIEVEFVD